MRATKPIAITTPKLVSSTIAEPYAPAAYVAGTTYGFGDIISVAADFVIYESLAAGNMGNTPKISPIWWRKIGVTETAYDVTHTYAIGDTVSWSATHRNFVSLAAGNVGNPLPVYPELKNTWWFDQGATMRYAMFDLSRNHQTVGPSPMTVVVQPNQRINTSGHTRMSCNTLILKGTSASLGGIIYPLAYSATKTYKKGDCMTVGLTTCYQAIVDNITGVPAPNPAYWTPVAGAVFDMNTRIVFDATTYCFTPITTRPSKSVFDIPQVTDIVLTQTLISSSGNCKIGGHVVGTNIYLGRLQKDGASNDGGSFSTVTRDKYSNATLNKQPMIREISGVLQLPSVLINSALLARESLDGEGALYNGLDEDGDWTDAFSLIGVLKQLKLRPDPGTDALLDFSAEEI